MNEALKNLMTRRACRKYKEEQLKPEDLGLILSAGQYAPTGKGAQSPIILCIQKPEDIKAVEELNAGIMGNPDAKPFYGAPTLIVAFEDTSVPFGAADATLVLGNIMNAANAVGVDSCFIWRARESFETETGKALKAKWGIPEKYQAVGNVILGYGLPEGKKKAAPRKEDYIRFI